MFTGIVEEVGVVERIARSFPAARLAVRAPVVTADVKEGDSICVDGVCLTVVAHGGGMFEADVQEETQRRTRFARYREGTAVNLERAVTPSTRLGGHYVQGHVDAVGIVRAWRQQGADWVLRVSIPDVLRKYVVHKGFIAVNGISLTVTESRNGEMAAHVIPHTRAATNLQHLSVGDEVNIEVDIIAKYVESLLK